MTGQALDHGEILSIRWAHDDPNPVAQDSIDRADKDALVGLMQAKGICLAPAAFEYPADYQIPDAKRQRIEGGGGDGSDLAQQHPDLAYPNTDGQFAAAAASSSTEEQMVEIPYGTEGGMRSVPISSPEYAAYYADYCAKYYAQQAVLARFGIDVTATDAATSAPETVAGVGAASSSSSSAAPLVDAVAQYASADEEEGEENEEDDGGAEEGGWSKETDDTTGAIYYFNSATGESSWEQPADYKE